MPVTLILLPLTLIIIKVSESGVHRPHVAGIHGRENEGSYSIVLSGGYEDDRVSDHPTNPSRVQEYLNNCMDQIYLFVHNGTVM